MFDAITADAEMFPDDVRSEPRHVPAVRATDGERLMRFRLHRDEAAFREVVELHAALVWSVCWQVLRHREDVEDAFQATFLILARKAVAIRAADSAAGWLYRVAFRTALAARTRRRRLGVESTIGPAVESLSHDPPGPLDEQLASIERAEQCEALLEELHSFGDRYRQPLVLCYLEGRTRQEAAEELGMTLAAVKGRLARGLRMLRTRLAFRGFALSGAAALMASEMAAAQATLVTAPVAETAMLGVNFAWAATGSQAAASAAAELSTSTSSGALLLANKGILAMKFAALVKPAIGLLAVGMTAGAIALAGAEAPRGGSSTAGSTTVVELAGEDSAATTGDDAAAPPVMLSYTSTPAAPAGQQPATYSFAGVAGSSDLVEVAAAAEPASAPVTRTATTIAAQPFPIRTGAQINFAATALQPPPAFLAATGMPNGTRKSMELELEHWELKARGLQKKAEALRLKARALASAEAGDVERFEADAEADLALAEVKLCEARAEQLRAALEQQMATINVSPTAPPADVMTFVPGSRTITVPAIPPLATIAPAEAAAAAAAAADSAEAGRQRLLEELRRANQQLEQRIQELEAQGEQVSASAR